MSDFSDRPFVAGSLVGLRAFGVDHLGRLIGPSFGGVFKPGENEADCKGGGGPGPWTTTFTGRLHTLSSMYSPTVVRYRVAGGPTPTAPTPTELEAAMPEVQEVELTERQHTLSGVNCTCGYYAYFNGDNDYKERGRVSALIEGYGVCTVGERGFRASKAKLVALVIPNSPRAHPEWYDRFASSAACDKFAPPMGIASMVVGVFSGVTLISLAAWWSILLGALLIVSGFAGLVLTMKASFHGIDRRYPNVSDVSACHDHRPEFRLDMVRRNYPDVPTYPTVKAALAAHPLVAPPPPVKPPLPTPDDDDFWTRSA